MADDVSTLHDLLRSIWVRAQYEVDTIFGRGEVELRDVPTGSVVESLQALEDALSSEAAFVHATAPDGGGLFEAAGLEVDEAAEVFGANEWNATAMLRVFGGTRFGVVRRLVRPERLAVTRLDLDAEKAAFGAFAYSTLPDPPATSRLPSFGTGRYAGEVAAVSGNGTFYSGDIEVVANFSRLEVGGRISNLSDGLGNLWEYQLSPVDRIILSGAKLRPKGNWAEPSGAPTGGSIEYASTFGRGLDVKATFRGQLRGTAVGAADEAVGVWSVGEAVSSGNYLAGSFGALRTFGGLGTTLAGLGAAINAPTPDPVGAQERGGPDGGPPVLSKAIADRVASESASRPAGTDHATFGVWRVPGLPLAPARDIGGLDPLEPNPPDGVRAPGAVPIGREVGTSGLGTVQRDIEPSAEPGGQLSARRAWDIGPVEAWQTDYLGPALRSGMRPPNNPAGPR